MNKPRKWSSKRIKEVQDNTSIVEQEKIEIKLAQSALIADGIAKKFMSKGAFARALGVSQSLVSRWLSGTHNFTTDTLVEIGHVLEINLLQLNEYALQSKNAVVFVQFSVHASVPKSLTDYSGKANLFIYQGTGT